MPRQASPHSEDVGPVVLIASTTLAIESVPTDGNEHYRTSISGRRRLTVTVIPYAGTAAEEHAFLALAGRRCRLVPIDEPTS